MNEEKSCGHIVTDECDCASRKPLDVNKYATKKTIAQGMLDIALLTANASQLKYILQVGSKHEFYTLMLSLIVTSIILQVSVGILFLVIGGLDIKRTKDQRAATILNDIILVLIFIISLINVIISSFGMEYTNNQLRLIKQNPSVGQAILGAVLCSIFNINKKKDQRDANKMNNVILATNIVIVALNVIISAFDLRDQSNNLRLNEESVGEYPTEASSSFFL